MLIIDNALKLVHMKFSNSTLSNTCSQKLSSHFFFSFPDTFPFFYPLPPPPQKKPKVGITMNGVCCRVVMDDVCLLSATVHFLEVDLVLSDHSSFLPRQQRGPVHGDGSHTEATGSNPGRYQWHCRCKIRFQKMTMIDVD